MTEEIRLECLRLAIARAQSGAEIALAAKFLKFVETGRRDDLEGVRIAHSVDT